ncbi:hypothetical protein HAX54_034935 [Datura stramonium]|uniref:Uncharacterized protein n=1 Tax=Datura stramonium TaxID=4076 RepID=A0ABS8VIG1_DATST|nr:hypothetical protein [Datura stramonium]
MEKSWYANSGALHNTKKNKYSLRINRERFSLTSLTPSQIHEDTKTIRERIEEDEKEKIERSKGVHLNIPREEKVEVVLWKENGISSEIDGKEKRDEHESKKETDSHEVLMGIFALKNHH